MNTDPPIRTPQERAAAAELMRRVEIVGSDEPKDEQARRLAGRGEVPAEDVADAMIMRARQIRAARRYRAVFTPVGWQVIDTQQVRDPVAEFGLGTAEYKRAWDRARALNSACPDCYGSGVHRDELCPTCKGRS